MHNIPCSYPIHFLNSVNDHDEVVERILTYLYKPNLPKLKDCGMQECLLVDHRWEKLSIRLIAKIQRDRYSYYFPKFYKELNLPSSENTFLLTKQPPITTLSQAHYFPLHYKKTIITTLMKVTTEKITTAKKKVSSPQPSILAVVFSILSSFRALFCYQQMHEAKPGKNPATIYLREGKFDADILFRALDFLGKGYFKEAEHIALYAKRHFVIFLHISSYYSSIGRTKDALRIAKTLSIRLYPYPKELSDLFFKISEKLLEQNRIDLALEAEMSVVEPTMKHLLRYKIQKKLLTLPSLAVEMGRLVEH